MEKKSWTTALILCFFFGTLGVHRLYLGYNNWWLQLITVGGFGIWTLIDFIKLLLKQMPDASGQALA